MNVEEFWNEFLAVNNKSFDTNFLEAFHFEFTEELTNKLLQLVLDGKKKATSSSLLAYEVDNSRIPQVGDYSIVTDWNGNPRCVIETIAVKVLPFKDITYDLCKLEGEDDNLKSWQDGHQRFFIQDGIELGYPFSKEMPVVFEEFKVVYTNNY